MTNHKMDRNDSIEEEEFVPVVSRFAIPLYLILMSMKYSSEVVTYFVEVMLNADVFDTISFDNLRMHQWVPAQIWGSLVDHREIEVERDCDEESAELTEEE